MGISQNFNKNLKKSVKKQTPSLPVGSKFIFQQLLKNSHQIEEDLEDTTIVEYNVGDLKQVMKNMKEKRTLNEAAKCQFSFECGAGKYCRKKNPDDFYGKCKKDKGSEMVGGTEKGLPIDKEETDLKDLIKRTVKEEMGGCGRKEGKCCDGGDKRKCGKYTWDEVNGNCPCSYAGPCCSGNDMVRNDDDVSYDNTEEEMGEATSTASSGAYSTPRFWAKNKKNQRFSTERWMPGAQYVKVKDKCKKFPYCNQGDINALKIWEQDIMKESAKNVSKKTGKPESEVREMIEKEIAEIIRRGFYKSPIKDLVGGGKMNTPIGKMVTMKGNKPKYES